MALHSKHARLVVQLLGHVLANALHGLATAATGVSRLVRYIPAQQVRRQRGTLESLAAPLETCRCMNIYLGRPGFAGRLRSWLRTVQSAVPRAAFP